MGVKCEKTLYNNVGNQTLLPTLWVCSHWFRVSEGATLDRGFALSSIQPSVLWLPNSADWRGRDRNFPHLSLVKWGMGGKTEGERELSVWMGAWFGLLEGWSTRVLKKSGKRRKTRENNVAKKKKEYNTEPPKIFSVCVRVCLWIVSALPFSSAHTPDSVCEAEKKGN